MYQIKLTQGEYETLQWAASRGYFPKVTIDSMEMIEEDKEKIEKFPELGQSFKNTSLFKDYESTYNIPEHAAWEILIQRENDSHSLYTCIGSPLLEKLLILENSIV